jgi:hypothetical protein
MARSTLRYVLPFALAGVALSGCGGGGSSPTGPTDTTAAAVPVPAAASPPTQQVVRQYTMSGFANGSRDWGCVRIQADSPPSSTPCGDHIGLHGDEGTRGTVAAEPAAGTRFVRWSSSSSDCPGESTNPCSFAFDRNKAMIAFFERTTSSSSSVPESAPKPTATASRPIPAPSPVAAPPPATCTYSPYASIAVPCPNEIQLDPTCVGAMIARGVPYGASAMYRHCAV